MKTVFTNNYASKLIIYFAGWGTPPEAVSHLTLSPEYDLLICYDYQQLTLDFNFIPYQEIYVIAWSLGVWVAERVLGGIVTAEKLTSAVAINGTGLPIDDQQGIPTQVFQATVENLTPNSRQKFERRMCDNAISLAQYRSYLSREFEDVNSELHFLFHQIQQDRRIDLLTWKKAIIGQQDRIFPVQNQTVYWQKRCPISYIESGHYLFNQFQHWEQLWA
ncbi:hypothetical protein CEP49_01905 [Mergibacter septicus]|uniref:DUF452 family protein n=1 Tax=Mergibacter septicus TaxID=221402 RepID=UPI001178FD32|nr:pimeloyl-ACP methyl esterase BioG family protein [Mergibacter septicus]AWX13388.1 hypothetical protein CEP49_01905 [Mergibacter septicus]